MDNRARKQQPESPPDVDDQQERLSAAFARVARRARDDAQQDPWAFIEETLVPGGGE
jgi:hypothetical protein